MTSSLQTATKEDGVTPADPFDDGAGSIRADRAVRPTLTFDVAAADYFAAETDPLNWVDLNLPSIDAIEMPRRGLDDPVRPERQRHPTRRSRRARPRLRARRSRSRRPPGVSPPAARWRSTSTISGEDLADGQYFGSITLDPASSANRDLHPGGVHQDAGRRHALAQLRADVDRHRCIRGLPGGGAELLPERGERRTERVEPRRSGVVDRERLLRRDPERDRVLVQRLVGRRGRAARSIRSTRAAHPRAICRWPTSTSIRSPGPVMRRSPTSASRASSSGRRRTHEVGLVSDGYAVIGGGDSSDVTFNPQDLPDPSRPNNVVAPFWTDLNTEFGGEMRIGSLTDGISSWLVLEWSEVSFYSTTDTVSFQIWIQTGATESVTFVYGADVPTTGDPGAGGVGLQIGGGEPRWIERRGTDAGPGPGFRLDRHDLASRGGRGRDHHVRRRGQLRREPPAGRPDDERCHDGNDRREGGDHGRLLSHASGNASGDQHDERPGRPAGPLGLVASAGDLPAELLSIATRAARVGGATIVAAGRTREGVEKSAGDYVTAVDGASERAIAGFLSEVTPDDPARRRGARRCHRRPLLAGRPAGRHHELPPRLPDRRRLGRARGGGPTDGRGRGGAVPPRDVRRSGGPRRHGRASGRPGAAARGRRRAADQAVVGTGFPFRHKEVLPRYYRALYAALERFEDLRRPGAAALDLAWVAAGVFDGFFELALGPWDVAAGAVLIRRPAVSVDRLGRRRRRLVRRHPRRTARRPRRTPPDRRRGMTRSSTLRTWAEAPLPSSMPGTSPP